MSDMRYLPRPLTNSTSADDDDAVQELHYAPDHLPSPAHASGTACQLAFVSDTVRLNICNTVENSKSVCLTAAAPVFLNWRLRNVHDDDDETANKKAVLYRKETARCRSYSFRFKVRRQHSLQV